MNGNFIEVDGIALHYLEKNSTGKGSIFFIHGNSASSRTWRKQWIDPVFNSWRLVAIDLPAHGDSAAALNPELSYDLPSLGKLIAQAVRRLAADKPYILVGVSMATNIIAEMLPFDISPSGLVLAGPCVFGNSISVSDLAKPGTQVGVVFTDEADPADIRMYGKETSNSELEEDLAIFITDYHKVKKPFRTILGETLAQEKYSDEIALLKNSDLPLLLIFGKDEKIVNPDYLDNAGLNLWNDRIIQISGASHLVHIDCPEPFNREVADFASLIFTKADS